jgi:hypothetical protein
MLKPYFVLWMLVTSGPAPEWYVMKTFSTQQDCDEQAVYLAQSLTKNTLRCLPSGNPPMPVVPKVKPRSAPGALTLSGFFTN